MMEEKILILLKPKASSDDVLIAIKESNLVFKFEKIIPMKKLGSIIVGYCNKNTQDAIKKLPSVADIEKSGTVSICSDD